ncbi:MAG: hypothetical protein JST42_17925 [Bacteroidetes bacterium]|nr:hypothetical protein [Bacteroidota bacterium]
MKSPREKWPELGFDNWKETLSTLHLWTQIVGKIRLRQMPWLNHSWHVTLYPSATGISTGAVPYRDGVFQIDFDFIHNVLRIATSTGKEATVGLYPRSVADFYRELFARLKETGVNASISAVPNEIDPAIPFEKDVTHRFYEAGQVRTFFTALTRIYNVFMQFRAGFTGKCSPVQLFWGSFDLAVTRFSGRRAPLYTGEMPNMPLRVMQEAYSHEVSSCGFWPGSTQFPHPAFYSYCYPPSSAFGNQRVAPKEAYFNEEMGEFLLLYEVVQRSEDPEGVLFQFLQSTYEAAANTGKWDRGSLECDLSRFQR